MGCRNKIVRFLRLHSSKNLRVNAPKLALLRLSFRSHDKSTKISIIILLANREENTFKGFTATFHYFRHQKTSIDTETNPLWPLKDWYTLVSTFSYQHQPATGQRSEHTSNDQGCSVPVCMYQSMLRGQNQSEIKVTPSQNITTREKNPAVVSPNFGNFFRFFCKNFFIFQNNFRDFFCRY